MGIQGRVSVLSHHEKHWVNAGRSASSSRNTSRRSCGSITIALAWQLTLKRGAVDIDPIAWRRRFRNDFDDFPRQLIYQKNLVFHLRITVVGELRDLLCQLRRKAIRLDDCRQHSANFRRKILSRFGSTEFELNLGVLG